MVEFPIPSFPFVFEPQHLTVPSVKTAQVCVVPVVTWTALLTLRTALGVKRSVVVPSPNLPEVLLPQHRIVRSARTAQV